MARRVVPWRPTRWRAFSLASTETTAVSPFISARMVASRLMVAKSPRIHASAAMAGARLSMFFAHAKIFTVAAPALPEALK